MRWDIDGLPLDARVPSLTIQPLLENAIYHGIEPLDRGGTVTITGRAAAGKVEIAVLNPLAPARAGQVEHAGNRLALDNIRERLALAYGGDGQLEIERAADAFKVTLRFPYEI